MWVAQSPVYYFSHSVCFLMFLCLATNIGSVLFLADIFLHSPNSHMEMLCGLHSHESSAKSSKVVKVKFVHCRVKHPEYGQCTKEVKKMVMSVTGYSCSESCCDVWFRDCGSV